jgi:hypothetical protein
MLEFDDIQHILLTRAPGVGDQREDSFGSVDASGH